MSEKHGERGQGTEIVGMKKIMRSKSDKGTKVRRRKKVRRKKVRSSRHVLIRK